MITLSAHKIGCELLNSILAMDNIDMEVYARVINALILIDPQPEESELFHDALKYACDVCKPDYETLKTLIEKEEAE